MGARTERVVNSQERVKLEKKAASRGIEQTERHVLLCAQSGCCKDRGEAKATRKTLNKARKKLAAEGIAVCVSEVGCLGLCCGGPLMVVYPEGVWYGRVTPEVCERIVEAHLREGEVVEDAVFARNPLMPL